VGRYSVQEVQTATKQKETQPAGGDLKPVEHATLVSSKEGDDGAHDDSAQARVQQLVTEAAKAQDKLEQVTFWPEKLLAC
jgi:hypothetical protein